MNELMIASVDAATFAGLFYKEVVFLMGAILVGVNIYNSILQARQVREGRDVILKLQKMNEHLEQNDKRICEILEILSDHKASIDANKYVVANIHNELKDLSKRHERLLAQTDILREDFLKHIEKFHDVN
jgi:hypothetical protein